MTDTQLPVRSERLAGRIAVVFGAGSVGPGWGNGKASAMAYARAGAKVVCIDVNPSASDETAALIAADHGTSLSLSCDITKLDAVKDTIDTIIARFGPIDILHNNVGHAKMGGPPDLSEEDWRREMDLNITGMFFTCKQVIPAMLERGKGVITNISSAAAIRYTGYPYSVYYASKGAVNQFTVGLALQYAKQGLRANAIMPGLMDTPMIYQQISTAYGSTEDMVKARHDSAPMGRMGTGWDIANAAVFLASDEASYITGVCLPVDGGLTMRAS